MKPVLLYNPPSEFYAMPLGLLAVGSTARANGTGVRIFDARLDGDAAEAVVREAARASAVGMTVFSGPPIAHALDLSRKLKRRYPGLPVVWGGWHPSILPEQCIDSGAVDVVVIGQGEAAFAEWLGVAEEPEAWTAVPGLCVRGPNGQPVRTAPRPLTDMNRFPPAAYDLLDVERYFRRKQKRQLDYSSSRGCPYRCTFCADPLIYASKWTGLDPDRVTGELMDLERRHGVEEVFFLDDDLFASPKRIEALVDRLIDAGTSFDWKGTARADELCRLRETFFPRLRQSGCRRINIGAESGSQPVLDRIRKQYRTDEIVTAGERLAGSGIGAAYSFITGFPGETEEDFRATRDMMKTLRAISTNVEARVYHYSPYPGTDLVSELAKRGARVPERLEDWADFSIESEWLPDRKRWSTKVRHLNFYLNHGYAVRGGGLARRLLRSVARMRCQRDWYGFAIEPYLARLARSLAG